MNREPSFPYDWIQPGEFRYCGCGHYLLPQGKLICAKCRYRPRLEDHLCFCGEPASMFFVHGFRCNEHAFQVEPSDAHITDKVAVTVSRMKARPNQAQIQAEMVECEQVHRQLESERKEIAENRRKDGYKPLFWLK